MPPPDSGSGARRVQMTTPSGSGSPDASPSVNGSAANFGVVAIGARHAPAADHAINADAYCRISLRLIDRISYIAFIARLKRAAAPILLSLDDARISRTTGEGLELE